MAAKQGAASLFGMGQMMADDEDDFDDLTEDDLGPIEEEDEGEMALGAGPFEAYAETIFSPDASTEEKTEALRQAFLTLLEEQG